MAIVRFDAIRSIANGSIGNTYSTVGPVLARNWRMFCISNNTDADMLISADGTTDNLFVAAGGFKLYDLSTNAANVQISDSFVMSIGTQFYVKYVSGPPTKNSLYIEGIYATGV